MSVVDYIRIWKIVSSYFFPCDYPFFEIQYSYVILGEMKIIYRLIKLKCTHSLN